MTKERYSIILALLFLHLFVFAPSIQAESGQAYEVGTDDLLVRKAPDKDAKIIGKLNTGDQLVAFDEKHGWVQTFYDGKKAWVASHYLVKTKSESNKKTSENVDKQIHVNADSVRLRSGPGTDHSIIGHTSNGDTYKLAETSGDWYKIVLDDDSTAWIAARLTKEGADTEDSSASKSKKTSDESSDQTKANLEGYNIILDPGHGGKDPGAIGINQVQEKDLTLTMAESVAEKLRSAGATVLLTRSDDTYLSLEERVRISEAYATDAFISLHYNAFPDSSSNGISTHYYENGPDNELAQSIQNEFEAYSSLNSRGISNENYHVLKKNSDVAVLVELGFITNPDDMTIIQSDEHLSDIANAITDGFAEYVNN